MNEHENPAGISRQREMEHNNSSVEEESFGTSANVHTLHSIPPAYANGEHQGNARALHDNHNHHQKAADMSGTTPSNALTSSSSSRHNHPNVPVHLMLGKNNTSPSRSEHVPPVASSMTAVPSRVVGLSYPPMVYSGSVAADVGSQIQAGTPISARRQQQIQQDCRSQYGHETNHQHYQQQEYQHYQHYQPQQMSYSPDGLFQQEQRQHLANSNKYGRISPTYPSRTFASDGSRQAGAYATSHQSPENADRELLSPTPQTLAAAAASGHMYRMHSPSRTHPETTYPNFTPKVAAAASAPFQKPYPAIAGDDVHSLSSKTTSAGRGNYPCQQYGAACCCCFCLSGPGCCCYG